MEANTIREAKKMNFFTVSFIVTSLGFRLNRNRQVFRSTRLMGRIHRALGVVRTVLMRGVAAFARSFQMSCCNQKNVRTDTSHRHQYQWIGLNRIVGQQTPVML